jgi:regulation of enolase protein 1 (concanavalin A-like superfamily)
MTFQWLNEPKKWLDNASVVTVHTDGKTDFWRKTRNGAERDNGHFYYRNLPGDQSFTATVNIQGEYNARYDQAGLMLRIDEKNWIKCGVEYVNGEQFASVVVTVNGWSDWSIVSINSPDVFKLRVKREKEAVHIEYAEGEHGEYKMMRLAYFPVIENSQSLMVGVMCASPNSDTQGFDVKFEQLNISEHA